MIEVAIEPGELTVGRESKLTVRFTNVSSGACSHIVFKLGLPPEILLLRGRDRIEIQQLLPGRSCSYDAIVRPRVAGRYAVHSPNFSYRNSYGRPVRDTGFRTEILARSAADAGPAGPPLRVEWSGRELALAEYDVLRLTVTNASGACLRNPVLTISGPIRVAPPGPRVQLPSLAAAGQAEASFVVIPESSGSSVPVQVRAAYVDEHGRTRAHDQILSVVVRRPGADRGPGGTSRQDTILYLSANPEDASLLRSDMEMKQVREQLQLGRYRDRFRIEFRPAVGLKDIGLALADCKPWIVHFSGHGAADGSLCLENENGKSQFVTPDGMAHLLGLHAATVSCVIVNACKSMRLAQAMSGQFDYVIAMRNVIGDEAAITFSIGFYQGLAGGDPIPAAFERGRAFLRAQQSARPDYNTPVLLASGRPETT